MAVAARTRKIYGKDQNWFTARSPKLWCLLRSYEKKKTKNILLLQGTWQKRKILANDMCWHYAAYSRGGKDFSGPERIFLAQPPLCLLNR